MDKIIDVLMKDDKWVWKGEEKEELKKEFKETDELSEIERNVLRAIILESKDPKVISRAMGYPEIVIKRAIEKLISKGYLDEELNPNEKVNKIRWAIKPIRYGRDTRVMVVDIAILITTIVLICSLLYHLGFIG